MIDLKDIWNSGERDNIPQEKLLAYLEGKLMDEERHEVERLLDEDSLESDALEGLQALTPEEMKLAADRLNHNLHHYLKQRKERRKRKMPSNYWTWIAIIIILLLAVVGFVLIRMIR